MTTAHLSAVQSPLSIACADEDATFSKADRDEAEAILKKNGYPYQINFYSHVHHGFAVRRAITSKAEVYAKRQAFIQAITWLDEHLLNDDKKV